MKFLANENFPFPSIEKIRALYEVISISEDFPGISDQEVLEKAIKNNLIILTFDRDYGEIIFRRKVKNPPAVIYFRLKGNTPVFAGELLVKMIKEQKINPVNKFTVVESNGIRQRAYKG